MLRGYRALRGDTGDYAAALQSQAVIARKCGRPAEALALLEPAATLLRENFKSWDEAFENYLDGYNWWAREDVGTKDPWTVTRGPYVKKLMQNYSELFDDAMFKKSITGVPGVTAESLLASVQ